MKTAIVDIDGIMWDILPYWHPLLVQINPALPYGPYSNWEFFEGYMTAEQALGAVDIIHRMQDKFPIWPDAKKLTKNLKNNGYYVHVASHRTARSYDVTAEWLKRNKVHFDQLSCCWDKHAFFGPDVELFIDDNPHSQEFALNRNVKTLSIRTEYNKHMEERGVLMYDHLGDLVDAVANL